MRVTRTEQGTVAGTGEEVQATRSITDPRSTVTPHPAWSYPLRALWTVVQATLWRLAWKRIYVLRPALLRVFGAQVAWRTQIAGSAAVYFPWRLTIGAETAIGPGVTLYNLGRLRIGERVVISQNAYLCGGTHDYTRASYPLICKELTIGDDVWIGASAFLCPGLSIGQGAVVGACSVVTRDVEPWTVVAGNPARIIRRRVLQDGVAC
jgi:putative colanic acid biosynthesis acetyltransferase WcaF